MKLSTLLHLPPQAMERVLNLAVVGKLDVAGLNVVTEPDRFKNMQGTPEADYFVFDGTERNQYTTVYGFETGTDKIVFTHGTVVENYAVREGANVAFTYGSGGIFGDTLWVYDVPTFNPAKDVLLL